jgi:hypothetical protein
MNRYCFENGRFVFEGNTGYNPLERLYEESAKRIRERLREIIRSHSIELYPYKRTSDGEVIFMTLREGCKDAKFSRVL